MNDFLLVLLIGFSILVGNQILADNSLLSSSEAEQAIETKISIATNSFSLLEDSLDQATKDLHYLAIVRSARDVIGVYQRWLNDNQELWRQMCHNDRQRCKDNLQLTQDAYMSLDIALSKIGEGQLEAYWFQIALGSMIAYQQVVRDFVNFVNEVDSKSLNNRIANYPDQYGRGYFFPCSRYAFPP